MNRTLPLLATAALLIAARPAGAQSTRPADAPNASPTTAPAAGPVTVAVFDFKADAPAGGAVGAQVAEVVTALLSSEPSLRLVERASLDKAVDELELNASGLVGESAARAGHLVGARLLVVGRVFTLEGTTYLSARVIGTETGVMRPVLVQAPAGRGGPPLGTLAKQLADGVAAAVRDRGASLLPTPAVDPLPPLIARAKNVLAGQKRTVFIKLPEQHFGRAAAVDPAAATELAGLLRRAGLEIAPTAAAADYLIEGDAFSEFGTRLGDLVSCAARVECRLESRAGHGATPRDLWSGRGAARAADLGEQTAGKLALETAARDAAVPILEAIAADRG